MVCGSRGCLSDCLKPAERLAFSVLHLKFHSLSHLSRSPMRKTALLLALIAASNLHADTLGELKARLATLVATDTVSASVAVERTRLRDGKPDPTLPPASITINVEAGSDGFSMQIPSATLKAVSQETLNADPEAKKPLTAALEQISSRDLNNYLDAAPKLLNALANATVKSETTDTFNGAPTRLLTLELKPALSKQDAKYIKELDASAKIWLNAAGDPVAAEQAFSMKGRAMLVISFEQENKERYSFLRVGDRLIVTEHHSHSEGSGAGENGGSDVRAKISLNELGG